MLDLLTSKIEQSESYIFRCILSCRIRGYMSLNGEKWRTSSKIRICVQKMPISGHFWQFSHFQSTLTPWFEKCVESNVFIFTDYVQKYIWESKNSEKLKNFELLFLAPRLMVLHNSALCAEFDILQWKWKWSKWSRWS